MSESTLNTLANTVTVTSQLAQAAAPIVSIYNPAAGAALSILAPVVSSFILTETQMILNLKKDMSYEEVISALEKSKSINWGIKPLETA